MITGKETGGWHTCTCADGSTYECKSKYGDGDACCGRSKPAICGEDSKTVQSFFALPENPIIRTSELAGDGLNFEPTFFAKETGGWSTCTCKDGSTYECKSKHGDGDQCCTRSMPAICGEGNVPTDRTKGLQGVALVFDNADLQAKEDGGENGWHTCTCADGSTYECKSKHGDGNQCCTRSKPAICGEDDSGKIAALTAPVIRTHELADDRLSFDDDAGTVLAKTTGGWHTCTCKDGSTYQCKSKHGEGDVPVDRTAELTGDELAFLQTGDTMITGKET